MWLQETNSPFPFLVDQALASYRAYGLDSSALRAWSPRNLLYYAKAKLQGRETLGNRGDTHQLGGDFVVGPNGRLRLAHPSRDPIDRPSIDQLLHAIRASQPPVRRDPNPASQTGRSGPIGTGPERF